MSATQQSSRNVRPRLPVFRALGRREPDAELQIDGRTYQLVEVFKHDSWAATGLYAEAETGARVVVKTNRQEPILAVPMQWLGRLLAWNEAQVYGRVNDLPGVPRFLGRVGATGIAHAFVPGRPLRRGEKLGDEYFAELDKIVHAFHDREIAIVDLEKPENVLVGDDGRPYLTDFQISYALPRNWLGRWFFGRLLFTFFRDCDSYHYRKHVYRCRPDLLPQDVIDRNLAPPIWLRLHRKIAKPFRRLRRGVLVRAKIRSGPGYASSEYAPEVGKRQTDQTIGSANGSGDGL